MLRYAPKAFAGEADVQLETSRQAQFTSQVGEQPCRDGGSVNKLIYFGNLSLPLSLFLPSLSKWMTTIWLRIWDVQAALTGELSGAQRSLLSAENSSEVRVQEPSLLSLSVSRTSSAARASWQVISTITITLITGVINNSPKAEQ